MHGNGFDENEGSGGFLSKPYPYVRLLGRALGRGPAD